MCSPQHTIVRLGLLAALAAVTIPATAAAQGLDRVEDVIDGESLKLSTAGTVRLLGVDVPKTVNGRDPWRAETDPAVVLLRRLIGNQAVRLEYDRARTDSAGTALAYVYLADGTSLNAEVLKSGAGRLNTTVAFARADEFRQYELEARTAGRGLWSGRPPAVPTQASPAPGGAPRPPGDVIIR
jgi:endonuclease YncB( thermonuclease family)